jgi:hypothetical protein
MLDEHAKQQVKDLCERIAKEQDQKQFSTLIKQLNDLLERSSLRYPQDGRDTISSTKTP